MYSKNVLIPRGSHALPLQPCEVGRARCGLYFMGQEVDVFIGCLTCLSQLFGPRLLVQLLLVSFHFFFVIDPAELCGKNRSLLSQYWVLAAELVHGIPWPWHLGHLGGTQAHSPRTPQFRHGFLHCLGLRCNSQQGSLSFSCAWKKRVIPSVPTD